MNKQEFKKCLSRTNELQLKLNSLKEELANSKKELMGYFKDVPEYKMKKYQIGKNYISYVENKQYSGITQKLLKDSLDSFISQNKLPIKTNDVVKYILSQRKLQEKEYISIKREGVNIDSNDEN